MLLIKANKLNRGFTLIEMMVVLTIMAVTSTILIKSTAGLQDQARYDQTVERVNQLKKAIISTSNLNGVPNISGFIADTGRLPNTIHDLLNSKYCSNDITGASCGATLDVNFSPFQLYTICPDGTYLSATVIDCTAHGSFIVSLMAGWNGPYISTSVKDSDPYAFGDGWGTSSTSLATANNYGWYYNASNGNGIEFYSFGANGCLEGAHGCLPSSDPTYDPEFPALSPTAPAPNFIFQKDWMVDIVTTGADVVYQSPLYGAVYCPTSSITYASTSSCSAACSPVTCSTPPTPTSLCLNIYYPYTNAGGTTNIVIISSTSTTTPIIEDGLSHPVHFGNFGGIGAIAGSIKLPAGNAAISLHIGACPATGATGPLYPSSRNSSISVKITPSQSPLFIW